MELSDYTEEKYIFIGRVIKKYMHKNMIMILVTNEGGQIRGIIKKQNCITFDSIKRTLCVGDNIRMEGVIQNGKDGKKEVLIRYIDILQHTRIPSVETGILEESRFQGVKSRQYYHTLMMTDPLCIFSIKARNKMIAALNQELQDEGYCMVSTPILQHNFFAGGARPFITRMLDSDKDMYLRITSEIALKMIIAGGMNKIYEIGSYFRNGSMNEAHAIPFEAVEIYQTYTEEKNIREMAQKILFQMQKSIEPLLEQYNVISQIDYAKKISEASFQTYVQQLGYSEFRLDDYNTYPKVPELSEVKGNIYIDSKLLYKWFKNQLIKNQMQPIWITDLPVGQSPLIEKNSQYTLKRSYLIANGATMAEAAQGEVDPVVLKDNLSMQEELNKMDYPRDYNALFHACKMGIPPVTSLFISLERFIPSVAGIKNINMYKMYI